MTASEIPHCAGCQRALTRIDHYGIEHLILSVSRETSLYRPLFATEGLASEVDLRCGFCGASLEREQRAFFYQRWYQMLDAMEGLG